MKFIVYFRLIATILFFQNVTVYAINTDCPNPTGSTNGGNPGQYGPFDYRDPAVRTGNPSPLQLVEMGHFTTEVATLTRGNTGSMTHDLDYTLRAFPNHHRALQSLADLGIRVKKIKGGEDMTYTIACYFIRAKNYAPTDGMVNALYAYYLANMNQKDLALAEVDQALKKAGTNPKVYYDAGLAYYYLGDLKKAQECSIIAKKLGSNAVGLANLLANKK